MYCGTKWFVRVSMEVLRVESATEGTNIRTATIHPAAINTDLLSTINHQGTAERMAKLYEQYGISPDRIANVVAFATDKPEDIHVGPGQPALVWTGRFGRNARIRAGYLSPSRAFMDGTPAVDL